MRADRLLQLMLLLQTHGCLTSKTLAARLEVSERTIHRDMEALSAAGIPVYAERGAAGGWRLSDGYRTDWAGLSREEIVSLLAAKPQRHVRDLGWSPKFEGALLKLLASLSPTLRRDVDHMHERLYVDPTGWHPSGEDVPRLPALQEAVWSGRMLRFDYASGSGSTGMRTVHPLGLVLKGTIWYLVALPDHPHDNDGECGNSGGGDAREIGEPRTYRVTRLRSAELLPEPALRPEDFRLAAYWERSIRRFRAELPRYPARALVHEDACSRLVRTRFVHITRWSESPADGAAGWREADIAFDTLESAADIAFSFGPQLIILEPEELQRAVTARAAAVLERYESGCGALIHEEGTR